MTSIRRLRPRGFDGDYAHAAAAVGVGISAREL